jgi:hypothetical protein
MDAKEFQNVVPPHELLENAAFQFLKSWGVPCKSRRR